jgi:hypothetical protein
MMPFVSTASASAAQQPSIQRRLAAARGVGGSLRLRENKRCQGREQEQVQAHVERELMAEQHEQDRTYVEQQRLERGLQSP